MADDNRPHDLYSALDSALTVMALSSQDWGAAGDFAWLYGIFVGWDNDPTGGDVDQDGGALDELATRFRWDAETVARLRRLRAAVAAFDINAVGDLAGRLLPSGGEVKEQWGRRRKRSDRDVWTPVFDEDRTREESMAGIGRWLRTYRQPCQLMRRQVTTWRGTDSVIFGDWEVVEDVPVVSDNSEVPNA